MKKVLKHLKKAHGAALRHDHKSVVFHAGHVLAATRQAMKGVPEEQDPTEPEPDTDQDDTAMGVQHGVVGAIPAAKLTTAAHSENPTLAKRANLAKTLKKMHQK